MRRLSLPVTLAGAATLALAGAAFAQYGPPTGGGSGSSGRQPDATVNANGNAFTDNLGFVPDDVSVKLGGVVAWHNTDAIAPHTATEDHYLWRLSGTYGSPGPYQGFGPGETVQRSFDAGTFTYFCEVHGREAMHGVVKVRDRVKLVERKGEQRLRVRWGGHELPEGQVFDVQRRLGGEWHKVQKGTRELTATFRGTKGRFRSRVRETADRTSASEWSPPAGA